MGWLNGSVALITGGGSGLGHALVGRFLAEGAKVGVLERDGERAEALAREFGGDVAVTVGDVASFEDNRRAVERAVELFGRLDTFVGNAGLFDFFRPITEFEGPDIAGAFDELFAVNVKGGLIGARAALPELLKSGGSMIFTVSNAGFYPGGGGAIYTASKHALVGMIRQLAHELAPRVRVNGVAPGGMRTGLSGLKSLGTAGQSLDQVEGLDQMLRDITPLEIAPTPEQYCGPYVLLASRDNAAPMTGTIINTDGGLGVRGIVNVRGNATLEGGS